MSELRLGDAARAEEEAAEIPRGFVSAEGKRKLVMTAAVITGIMVFLQIAVSMGMSIYGIVVSGFGDIKVIDPDRGAYWKGGLWLLETEPAGRYGARLETRLLRWTEDGEGELVEMATFKAVSPQLVPDGDRLWIVSPDVVGTLSASGIRFDAADEWIGIASSPFLSEAQPALITETPEGREVRRFRDGAWQRVGPLSLGSDAGFSDLEGLIVTGEPGSELLVTYSDDGLIASPDGVDCLWTAGCPDRWDVVIPGEENVVSYAAAIADGQPVIFAMLGKGLEAEIVGYRRIVTGWEKYVELEYGLPGAIGVFPTDKPGRLLLVCQGFPGTLTGWEIVGGDVRGKLLLGEDSAPPTAVYGWTYLSNVVTLVFPFLMALLLAPRMRRLKTQAYRTEQRSAPFASVLRRGLACGVDTLIAGGPLIGSFVFFMGVFTDMETSPLGGMLDAAAFMTIAVLWGLLCFFLMSFWEGRTGKTPGKALFGIRTLNLELEPCGFGRALLRNLLMVADGMFSCVVGVLLIAITPSWQRVGDLVGRTVVVRGAASSNSAE
ncbi:MAG: RDD family protein [Deltaproteobacteria bacterium]|nr:RDD family protein [Deltaproteobacteria bacterium]